LKAFYFLFYRGSLFQYSIIPESFEQDVRARIVMIRQSKSILDTIDRGYKNQMVGKNQNRLMGQL